MESNTHTLAEQSALLRLLDVPGLGAVRLSRLRKQFASASELLYSTRGVWAARDVPKRLWPGLEAARHADVSAVMAELAKSGAWLVGIFDAAYPELLREIHDPPPALFGKGDPGVLSQKCVAVVGARRHSKYGSDHAYRIARGLAEAGITVVSGLAIGIDAVAHKAAMEAGGFTAAVLGSGIENVYPAGHKELAVMVARRGAVISELRPYCGADRVNFPRRNRIISGLCRGIVIVEAREDSGSLITAREGADQGRDVFVVPGPAGGANRGGHKLLADGAHWAEDAEDVIRALWPAQAGMHAAGAAESTPALKDEWLPVWGALTGDATHVDTVIERTGLRSADVLGILLQMELHGLVRQEAGKRFVRER